MDNGTGAYYIDVSNYAGTAAYNLILQPFLGNVGIGTTSPAAKLEVSGDILLSSTNKIGWRYVSGNGYYNFITGDDQILTLTGGTWTSASTQAAVRIKTVQGEKVTVLNNGNFGIGVTSPLSPLTIQASSGASALRFIGRSGDSIAGVDWYNSAQTAGTYLQSNGSWIRSRADGGFHFSDGSTPTTTDTDGFTIEGMNVGIGETSPDTTLHVKNSGSIVLTIERPGDGKAVSFSNGPTEVGWISYTDSNGVSYNSASDYRLKEDLQDFNGLDKISKIKMYDYKWKSGNDRSYGAMAHELQEIIPYAVSGEKDGEDMQGVDYSKVVPLLVKSIQEQQKQIEELKQIIKNK